MASENYGCDETGTFLIKKKHAPQGVIVSECYECEQTALLIYKSRCADCVIRRLEFNERENEELRMEIADLENDYGL